MKIKTMRAALERGTFDQIVEALQALATDPDADPKEAAKAEAALKEMIDSPTQTPARRAMADRAHNRVTSANEMRERMGLGTNRTAITHEGRRSTFRVLTSEDARRHLASKS